MLLGHNLSTRAVSFASTLVLFEGTSSIEQFSIWRSCRSTS
jgi:hypothetical protein